jgi:hypothetical protein
MKTFIKAIIFSFLIVFVCLLSACSNNSENEQVSSSTIKNTQTQSSIVSSSNTISNIDEEDNKSIIKVAEDFINLHISNCRDVAKSPEKYDEFVTPACKEKLFSQYDRATIPDDGCSIPTPVKMSVKTQSTYIQKSESTKVKTLSPVYISTEIGLKTGAINNSEPYIMQLELVKTDKWRVDKLVAEISLRQITSHPIDTLFP